ncbi:BLUF domain-containing protein [Homoserinibacter sp. YIM 151385]|uniref:BLUF domain-containing protein n=1 Tax=Homoserinibacter sp. YIM 151385 TaxID=2985506 RepID=UPI0022F01CC9|nr:BLUF domain-containing protein [Homoserinibacter sp. YIM 151385]WBU37494.1 BLUF domain-containing protein [Homoserinibacter sp. YIM 151385]
MADDEDLYTALYTSRSREPFDDGALDALLRTSRAANAERRITGMLLYRGGRFVQVLEGPRRAVLELLDRIRDDERHSDVRVLIDGPIAGRDFDNWSMGFQPMQTPTEPPPPGFRDTFVDLDDRQHPSVVMRAARELSLWFRTRPDAAAASGA